MQITINLPNLSMSQDEIKTLLAIKMFKDGIVSLGAASEIAGYQEKTFIELLTHRGISPFKFSVQEYEGGIENG